MILNKVNSSHNFDEYILRCSTIWAFMGIFESARKWYYNRQFSKKKKLTNKSTWFWSLVLYSLSKCFPINRPFWKHSTSELPRKVLISIPSQHENSEWEVFWHAQITPTSLFPPFSLSFFLKLIQSFAWKQTEKRREN